MNAHDVAPRLGLAPARFAPCAGAGVGKAGVTLTPLTPLAPLAPLAPQAPRAGRSQAGRTVLALTSSHRPELLVRTELIAPSTPAARELRARLRPLPARGH